MEFSPKLVCDWLLHRGYKLTALELLVESEQAGKLDEVVDLQLFFSDQDRFPQDELAKYQGQNALDVQAMARDREERLQMTEYELRLAKEDLDDLRSRAQHAARMKHSGRELRPSEGEAAQTQGPRNEAEESVHSPRSLRISIGSEDLNLNPAMSTPETMRSHIDPSSLRVINSAVLSHLLRNQLKMTALTLQDEAGLGEEALPSMSSRARGDLEDNDDMDGMEIWKWMQAAERERKHRQQLHSNLSTPKAKEKETGGQGDRVTGESEDQKREREKDEEIERLLRELEESRKKAAELKEQNRKAHILIKQYQMGGVPTSPASFSTNNPSMMFARGSHTSMLFANDVRSSSSFSQLSMGGGGAASTSPPPASPLGPPPVDPEVHNRLRSIVTMLLELMPRLMPSLTSKAKLESLPIIEALVSDAKVDAEQRTSLVSLILNLISTPDDVQRKAIFASLESLAEKLGPAWVSSELLTMCSKQVTNPASERRILAAQLLALCARQSDFGTPHIVLNHLQKLTEDRIEQVREAAIHSIATLIPRLPSFSRQHYQAFEDVILDQCTDGSEALLEVIRNSFLPVVLSWAEEADVVVTSLMPKVMTKLGDCIRHAVEKHHPGQGQAQGGLDPHSYRPGNLPLQPVTFSDQLASFHHHPFDLAQGGGLSSLDPHPPRGLLFPNHDYQVAYHLMGMFVALLPALRISALRACPHSLLPSAHFSSFILPKEANATDLGADEENDASAAIVSPPSPFSCQSGVKSASSAALAAMTDAESDAVFSSWAGSKDPGQWKVLKWFISFIVPNLIETARTIPMSEDTLDVRRQLALTLSFTAVTFGSGFNASTLLPLFASASGCQPVGQATPPAEVLGQIVPEMIRESAQDLMPRTPEETRFAREKVLPMMLAGLLPPSGLLAMFLSLALSSSDTLTGRWVVEMPRELHAAVAFVADVHGPDLHTPELLSVLEKMAAGRAGMGTITTAVGVSSVSVIQGLLPAAAASAAVAKLSAVTPASAKTLDQQADEKQDKEVEVEEVMEGRVERVGSSLSAGADIMKRRLMPLLMLLMSRGDAIVQGSCIWALLEVLLRFGEDTKLVEQVCIVFDGLLDPSSQSSSASAIPGGGADVVSATVLAAMNHLAASVSPSASRSPASANMLEWLLNSVLSLATSRLGVTEHTTPTASPATAAASQPLGSRSAENQRLLAGQLMHIMISVHAHDTRLPRLHTLMVNCIEQMYKNRYLLVAEHSVAIGNMRREKAAVSGIPSNPEQTSSTMIRSNSVTKSSNSKEKDQMAAPTASSAIPFASSSSSLPQAGELPSSGDQTAPVSGMRARLQMLRQKLGGGGNGNTTAGSNASILSMQSTGSAATDLPPVHKLAPGVSLQYNAGSPGGGRMSISGARHHHRTASTFGFFSDDEKDAA